jgi:hypothetical protein
VSGCRRRELTVALLALGWRGASAQVRPAGMVRIGVLKVRNARPAGLPHPPRGPVRNASLPYDRLKPCLSSSAR